jgi:VanZ family protein
MNVWWPVLLAITVIFFESTQFMGANNTSGPLRHLFEAVFGPIADDRWMIIHHIVRKCGHFFGYGLMSLAWLRAWTMSRPNLTLLGCGLAALLSTTLVASCDEWHQATLPNRTGTPSDVLLDSLGALVLLFLVLAWERFFHPAGA